MAFAVQSGLFERALREALDGAMSIERANAVIAKALERASLAAVPEDLVAFQQFVQGPLTVALASLAGPDAMETVVERLSHVLWMASSTVRSFVPSPRKLATTFETEADESSGLRAVDGASDLGAMNRAKERPTDPAPAPERPARRPMSSGAQSIGRMVAPRPSVTMGAVLETRVERTPARGPVLVTSLDAALLAEVEGVLGERRPAAHVRSQADLVRAIGSLRTTGFSVIVDTALPSVELPTFVGLSSLLPPGTRVVLWGLDPRQKKRMAMLYPIANDWIACDDNGSLRELLIDRDD